MKIIRINSIIVHLLVSYTIFMFTLVLFGSGLERLESYLVSCFAALLSVTYISHKFYKLYQINLLNIALVGIFIKLLIGFMFWQFYLWPDYFSQNSIIVFDHFEYLQTPKYMKRIAEYRIKNGIYSIPVQEALFLGKYFFITYIMSNLYLSGNFNLLDLSIQNTLFSIYTAIVICLIGMKFDLNRKHIKTIFIISLFQPFSLISSMVWRDFVGQFFVIFGFYILICSFNNKIIKVSTTIVVASFSMALLRTVYIFIPVMLYCLKHLKSGLMSVWQNFVLIAILSGLIFVILRTQLINFLVAGYAYYFSSLINPKFYLNLPLDYTKALVGPFPWVNWFAFDDNSIFLISNYLQAVYILVILYFTARYYRYSNIDIKLYIAFLFFILLSMGIVTEHVHTEYFSFAAALLVPISVKYFSIGRFLKVYGIVFIGFLMLNIIYVGLGINGAGLHTLL
jgi:hypothetical protein